MSEKYGVVVRAAERKRREDERAAREEAFARLKASAASRMRTTMVGAISAVEEAFGHLWGLGKPRQDLTDREFRLDAEWRRLRERIFDIGNKQIRAIEIEVEAFYNGSGK